MQTRFTAADCVRRSAAAERDLRGSHPGRSMRSGRRGSISSAWRSRSCPLALVCYAIVPAVYYGLLDAKRLHPLHSIMVFDLGGITHFTQENQFPVHMERGRDQAAHEHVLSAGPLGRLLVHDAVLVRDAAARTPGRRDLRHAAADAGVAASDRRASHRLSAAPRKPDVEFSRPAEPGPAAPGLGRAGRDLRQEAAIFQPLLDLHRLIERTILFRPGLWLVLAIGICAAAWRMRATPGRRVRHRRHGLGRRLRHDFFRGGRGVGLPLRLLVRTGGAGRRRGGAVWMAMRRRALAAAAGPRSRAGCASSCSNTWRDCATMLSTIRRPSSAEAPRASPMTP